MLEKDWLAEEIKYESKISAWDLDEPRMVRMQHEKDCPRKKVEKQHIKIHSGNERMSQIQSRLINKKSKDNPVIKGAEEFGLLITIIMFILFLIGLIANFVE